MRKKISEMTDIDKAMFLKQVKQLISEQYGIPWEYIEKKIRKNMEDTFDDEKFAKMDPDFRIDAAYARKEFGNKKPEFVDYMIWNLGFVTNSDSIDF